MSYLWAIVFGYISKIIVAVIIPITTLTYPLKGLFDTIGLRKISVKIVLIITILINAYAFLLSISTCVNILHYYLEVRWAQILLSIVFFIQYILLANRIIRANRSSNPNIPSYVHEINQGNLGITVLIGFILFNFNNGIFSPLFSWPFDLIKAFLP